MIGLLRRRLPLVAKRRIALRRLALRRSTAPWRMLPGFLLVGGQRCGTSSLYKHLCQHPAVARPLRKEIEYFSTSYFQGPDWYRAHFPLAARRRLARAGGGDLTTFEATPDYLLHPLAAERAAAMRPEARIVAVLRDPVARAHSHHRHMVRLGLEDLSFERAVDAEAARCEGEVERLLADPRYKAHSLRRHSYLARGRYAEHLEPWLARYPPERVLILRSEDLFAEPGRIFRQLLDFLGLAPFEPREFRNWSYGDGAATTPPELEPALERRLRARFSEPNRRLRELTGRDFGWPGEVGAAAEGA